MSGRRVLHLCIADDVGGAARSAYKIHKGVRALGVPSRMLVAFRFKDDPDVRSFRPRAWRAVDRVFRQLDRAVSVHSLLVPSTAWLLAHPWLAWADVVQLYNLHGGWISQLALPLIARRKRVIYRLSDMWAMTGHCAFSAGCERFRVGCGHCPHLDDYPSLPRDTTALNWRIKDWLYRRSRFELVAPSTWIERLARESPLLGRYPVVRIPNGVDIGTFAPTPKAIARRELGLPEDGTLVLFSGTEARKGGALLALARERLAAAGVPVVFVTVGHDQSGESSRIDALHLGQIADDRKLARIYSAADIFALPARADNLPNTILEAFACGTPAVSFDVGGVRDAVRHLETGYLARSGDVGDLVAGIAALAQDSVLRLRLGGNALALARSEFSLALQGERFAALYSGPRLS